MIKSPGLNTRIASSNARHLESYLNGGRCLELKNRLLMHITTARLANPSVPEQLTLSDVDGETVNQGPRPGPMPFGVALFSLSMRIPVPIVISSRCQESTYTSLH
jgi:hypothetical protein